MHYAMKDLPIVEDYGNGFCSCLRMGRDDRFLRKVPKGVDTIKTRNRCNCVMALAWLVTIICSEPGTIIRLPHLPPLVRERQSWR